MIYGHCGRPGHTDGYLVGGIYPGDACPLLSRASGVAHPRPCSCVPPYYSLELLKRRMHFRTGVQTIASYVGESRDQLIHRARALTLRNKDGRRIPPPSPGTHTLSQLLLHPSFWVCPIGIDNAPSRSLLFPLSLSHGAFPESHFSGDSRGRERNPQDKDGRGMSWGSEIYPGFGYLCFMANGMTAT